MKMNITKYTMSFALTALLTTAIQATAGDNSALSALSTVAISDLPAKASALIQQATPKDRQQMAIDVVKAAIGLDAASAPSIVAAIAKSMPDLADVVAATAAGLVPDQAEMIARAAATSAPSMAGKIVQAICTVLPKQYKVVAEAVAEVVPGAAKEILAGVYAAIPSLKNSIQSLIASYNGNIPSVMTVLDQAGPNQPKPTIQLAMTPNLDKSEFAAPVANFVNETYTSTTTSTGPSGDTTTPATGGNATGTQ
jgi:hypothetical protein